ncbi:MAG: hypothetical protein ACRDF9_15115, partial [Candidatus Limnocylindria bacterium]
MLVLGASGALVTATVDNGMTTITITQPSETSTGSSTTGSNTTTTNTTVEQAILALFTRTSAEDDPTAPATAKGCSDEAHARNVEMKRVNDHSPTAREAVSELAEDAPRTSDARKLVKDADKEIKDIRRLAVKAIHATFDCDADNEDEDADEDADEDEDIDEDEDEDTTSTTTTTVLSLDFTGDAEAIADLAIELMDQVVADLEEALEGLEDSDEATTNANGKQNGKSDSDRPDNTRKGNGKGRN